GLEVWRPTSVGRPKNAGRAKAPSVGTMRTKCRRLYVMRKQYARAAGKSPRGTRQAISRDARACWTRTSGISGSRRGFFEDEPADCSLDLERHVLIEGIERVAGRALDSLHPDMGPVVEPDELHDQRQPAVPRLE